MKVSRQELDNFGLLQSLPEPLKNMVSGDNFVFYYNVDEENAKLTVYEYEVVKQVNVTLYRDIQFRAKKAKVSSLSIGFFTDSFETIDGLFYQFLRTYNEIEKVKTFYSYLVGQDKIVDINVSTDHKGAEEMINKSGQRGVPVIDIDGHIIVGFQPELFDKILNQ